MAQPIEAVFIGGVPPDKWPHTDDKDYTEYNARRNRLTVRYGGFEVTLVTRVWNPFQAFAAAGAKVERTFPYRSNTTPPEPGVAEHTQRMFAAMAAEGVSLCVWQEPWHGYPETTCALRSIFKHSAISTMNDCPMTTPLETGRIAGNFNSAIHGNLTWTAEGEHTASMYRRLGVESTYYYTQPTTPGLIAEANGVDLETRIQRMRAGQYSHDVVFVGTLMGSKRQALNEAQTAAAFEAAGVRSKIHGWSMRDGDLLPKALNDVSSWGVPVARLYADAFSVLNVGEYGLMGMRPHDAWQCGTLLIQHDPFGELGLVGVKAGVHYAEYDGTIAGLIDRIRYYQTHLDEAESIIRQGFAYERVLQEQYNFWATVARMIMDHREKWGL